MLSNSHGTMCVFGDHLTHVETRGSHCWDFVTCRVAKSMPGFFKFRQHVVLRLKPERTVFAVILAGVFFNFVQRQDIANGTI